jgi:hypothetical protein
VYDTFSQAYTEVLDRCRSINNDTDYVALAKSYVNKVHKETLAYRAWPFLNKRGTLVTQPPYTTGTVAITQNSGAIVGTGTTFTAAHVGSYLKIGSSPDIHLVTTYISATSLTVDPVVALETASAQSFKLFKMGYALPDDFRLPDEVDNFITSPPMDFAGAREYRRLISAPIFDIPTKWTLLWSQDGAPVPTIAFFPFALTYRQIHFDYQITVADLSGANDPIQLPDPYRAIPVEGAMALMYRDVFDDDRANDCEAERVRLRNQMASDYGFFDDAIQLQPHNYRGTGMTGDDLAIQRTVWENR